MTRGTLVFDFEPTVFWDNRILDPVWASRFPGAIMFSTLGERARASGFDTQTADVFLRSGRRGSRALVVTDGFTRFTKRLARTGADLSLLFSGESPGIIPRFYHRLERYSAPYRHALLFRGFAHRIARGVAFHPFRWPFADARMRAGPSFHDRQTLVMVASHKRRFPVRLRHPARTVIGNALRYARWEYYRAVDPMLRFPDHYRTRLEAVEHFASRPYFQLFGSGWSELGLPGLRPRFAHAPTVCDDKIATMSRFRFSLAFENSGFPGYVTEKIFDSLLAGCVPVYCGAPDIEDFCPRDCFLDLADYGTYAELERLLLDFTERDWCRKREAISDFLASTRFAKHQLSGIVDDAWQWLIDA
jgi:hypothetical protein